MFLLTPTCRFVYQVFNLDSEYCLDLLERYSNIYSDEYNSEYQVIFLFIPLHAKHRQNYFPKYQLSFSFQPCLEN